MRRFGAAAALATGALVNTSAFALAQRTFVSTNGSDSAACSLAAPCRSFAAALVQTATGGEVVVLDSGGYGAVAISKDVSIIAPKGVYGGITAFPTSPNATGITVFDARVVLRGLSGSLSIDGLTWATVADNLVSDNANEGIIVAGYGGLIVSNNTVTFNGKGLSQLGSLSAMYTRGNNTVAGFGSNLTGTLTPLSPY